MKPKPIMSRVNLHRSPMSDSISMNKVAFESPDPWLSDMTLYDPIRAVGAEIQSFKRKLLSNHGSTFRHDITPHKMKAPRGKREKGTWHLATRKA